MKFAIRRATIEDMTGIHALYRRAADGQGLARRESEMTATFVAGFLTHALKEGLSLVLLCDDEIVGEIHAAVQKPKQFAHVMSDLTIALDPRVQGRGQGRALFQTLIDDVRANFPQVRRIELGCRESNTRAIALYESLGFRMEGRLKGRVYDEAGDFYEDDLMMGKDMTTS
jgi:ribosomal protein S18 acetylase RimI-like enzyme